MFHEDQKLGEYTLIKKLGRGGFGEVWLAEFKDEQFAIKLPHKDQVEWQSITQEIGLWTLCGKHPNVMPLIGARNFNGQIAIISEYAPDGSLEDLLKRKGKLSEIEAVEMIIGVLKGLQHLHESGIIHRDLKPANILLDGNTLRLTDFGISRIINGDSSSQTIAGTFAYMAPECFDGKRNVQTDVWSVGVILHRMITGNLPFPQKEMTTLIGSLINDDFNEINKLRQLLSHFSPSFTDTNFDYRIYDIVKAYSIDQYQHINSYLNTQSKIEELVNYFYKEFGFLEDDLNKIKPYILKIIKELEDNKTDWLKQLPEIRERIYRHLRKDLFNLVSKSIEKDTSRRYKSAKEMEDEMQIWFNDEFHWIWQRARSRRRLESAGIIYEDS